MKNTKPEFPESVKKKIVAIMKTCFEKNFINAQEICSLEFCFSVSTQIQG